MTLADRLRGLETARELAEPDGLDAELRPYQRRGLAWLAEMARSASAGAWPTTWASARRSSSSPCTCTGTRPTRTGPTLVVCPASVLGNWEREAARFAPGAPGAPLPRRRTAHLDDRRGRRGRARHLRRGPPRPAELWPTVEWGLVVADEAQHVKNPLARTARELRADPGRGAASPSPARRSRTGWSSCGRSSTGRRPACSGRSRRFRRSVAGADRARRHDPRRDRAPRPTRAAVPAAPRASPTPTSRPTCRPRPRPTIVVQLTAEQATLYGRSSRERWPRSRTRRAWPAAAWCSSCSPRSSRSATTPPSTSGRRGPLAGRSGKLDAFDEMLGAIVDEGDAVLVFTQYVAMGRLLERHLAARGIAVAFLHGGVHGRRPRGDGRRASRPARSPVFLLSLKAGGTGLNLTARHPRRPLRPLVEPRGRGPGHRPGLAHRPGPARAGAPARLAGARSRTASPRCSRPSGSWPTPWSAPARAGSPSCPTTTSPALVALVRRRRLTHPWLAAFGDHLVGPGVGRRARAPGPPRPEPPAPRPHVRPPRPGRRRSPSTRARSRRRRPGQPRRRRTGCASRCGRFTDAEWDAVARRHRRPGRARRRPARRRARPPGSLDDVARRPASTCCPGRARSGRAARAPTGPIRASTPPPSATSWPTCSTTTRSPCSCARPQPRRRARGLAAAPCECEWWTKCRATARASKRLGRGPAPSRPARSPSTAGELWSLAALPPLAKVGRPRAAAARSARRQRHQRPRADRPRDRRGPACLELTTGSGNGGLALDAEHDLARRAASLLGTPEIRHARDPSGRHATTPRQAGAGMARRRRRGRGHARGVVGSRRRSARRRPRRAAGHRSASPVSDEPRDRRMDPTPARSQRPLVPVRQARSRVGARRSRRIPTPRSCSRP